MFDKLGITWQGMLFHIAALIILIVALTFILYKPMKKMIASHRRKIDEIFDENEKLNQESANAKTKYEGMVKEVREEAMRVSTEASRKAEIHAEEIIAEAQSKAKNILNDAKKEVAVSKQRQEVEFKKSVERMAVEIAGKVLEREVSEKDNKAIIDTYLNEWDK